MAVKPPPSGFPPWTTTFDLGRAALAQGWPEGNKLIGIDWDLYRPFLTPTAFGQWTAAQKAAGETQAAALGTTLTDLVLNPLVIVRTVIQMGPNTIGGRTFHIIGPPPNGSAVLQLPSSPNFRFRCGRNALTGEEIICEFSIATWGESATLIGEPVGSFTGFTPEAPFIPAPMVLPESQASVTGNLDQTMVIFPPPPSETITYDTSQISGPLPPAPSSQTGSGPPTLAPQSSYASASDLGAIGAQAIGTAATATAGLPPWFILALVAVGVYVVWKGGR